MRLLHVTDVTGCRGKEYIPEEAMYRGRYVHLACHHLDGATGVGASGITEEAVAAWWASLHPPYVGFIRAWETAKRDLGIVVVASEEPVSNERYGYQGTRDKRITMTGRRGQGILDLKCDASCSGKIPETTGLQVAGYVGENKLWRAAVALHPDGTFRFHDDRNNTEIFRAGDWREFCCRLAVMQADISRGWAEPPKPREE